MKTRTYSTLADFKQAVEQRLIRLLPNKSRFLTAVG
jgi:hypothetical protein